MSAASAQGNPTAPQAPESLRFGTPFRKHKTDAAQVFAQAPEPLQYQPRKHRKLFTASILAGQGKRQKAQGPQACKGVLKNPLRTLRSCEPRDRLPAERKREPLAPEIPERFRYA
jgi:hypothetical protein